MIDVTLYFKHELELHVLDKLFTAFEHWVGERDSTNTSAYKQEKDTAKYPLLR